MAVRVGVGVVLGMIVVVKVEVATALTRVMAEGKVGERPSLSFRCKIVKRPTIKIPIDRKINGAANLGFLVTIHNAEPSSTIRIVTRGSNPCSR